MLGDFPTHERLVRDLVAGSGATAVFVEYDRSPEAHYPVAINQAYAATTWVAAHGKEIGVDGGRLAAVGNSVGGNMAAVVALMGKDRGTPNIRCQVLLWPVTRSAGSAPPGYRCPPDRRVRSTGIVTAPSPAFMTAIVLNLGRLMAVSALHRAGLTRIQPRMLSSTVATTESGIVAPCDRYGTGTRGLRVGE